MTLTAGIGLNLPIAREWVAAEEEVENNDQVADADEGIASVDAALVIATHARLEKMVSKGSGRRWKMSHTVKRV